MAFGLGKADLVKTRNKIDLPDTKRRIKLYPLTSMELSEKPFVGNFILIRIKV